MLPTCAAPTSWLAEHHGQMKFRAAPTASLFVPQVRVTNTHTHLPSIAAARTLELQFQHPTVAGSEFTSQLCQLYDNVEGENLRPIQIIETGS